MNIILKRFYVVRWQQIIELAQSEQARLQNLHSTNSEFCESLDQQVSWTRDHVTRYVTEKHSIDTKLQLEAEQARFEVKSYKKLYKKQLFFVKLAPLVTVLAMM